jgi:hypothetical protein
MGSYLIMTTFLGLDINLWSIGLSIIALLFTFTKDFFLPFVFKPKLVLEGENDDECVDDALGDTIKSRAIYDALSIKGFKENEYPEKVKETLTKYKIKMRWLRLRIKNNGDFCSRTANNCYVKLIGIRNGKGQLIRPFNAFPLMWVSYATSKNNLSKGEYHLLDLAYEIEGERSLYPATWGPYGLPNALSERKKEKLGPDIYTFIIGVYGDNFDPFQKEIKIELTQQFGELKFVL